MCRNIFILKKKVSLPSCFRLIVGLSFQNLFIMKKFFVTIALFIITFQVFADEGMWLPMLLGEQVYNNMVLRGLKLTKEQLYSINKASIKDAVIIFGGGCTGEIVSNEGLIFTNHHCGYSAITASSTIDHNYLQKVNRKKFLRRGCMQISY